MKVNITIMTFGDYGFHQVCSLHLLKRKFNIFGKWCCHSYCCSSFFLLPNSSSDCSNEKYSTRNSDSVQKIYEWLIGDSSAYQFPTNSNSNWMLVVKFRIDFIWLFFFHRSFAFVFYFAHNFANSDSLIPSVFILYSVEISKDFR